MNQGFIGPVWEDPFSTPTTIRLAQSAKKPDNSLLMKGLHGFPFELWPSINIYGGYKGTFIVTLTLTHTPGFDAPGTASDGLSSVLIGDFLFLDHLPPILGRAL